MKKKEHLILYNFTKIHLISLECFPIIFRNRNDIVYCPKFFCSFFHNFSNGPVFLDILIALRREYRLHKVIASRVIITYHLELY